jgi:hypothetical protein
MAETAEIKITQVRPNDWNPNIMTRDEFNELTAEIKYLGKPPKPLVLRSNGSTGSFEIVDGEHAYRAMIVLGIETLKPGWYEIEQYDDFEAMRQTYKRNQHGTHNPIKQGQLFKRMMTERSINQSDLAREMEVSEGTVRNSLEYVKALDVRNGYEDWKVKRYAEIIAELPVRVLRELNSLPVELGNLWLEKGADPEDLPGGGLGYVWDLIALVPILRAQSCRQAIDRLQAIKRSLRLWGFYQRLWKPRAGFVSDWTGGLGLPMAEALPYLQLFLTSRWFREWGEHKEDFLRDLLEAISRPAGDKAKIVLPLEVVRAWMDYPEAMNLFDLRDKLRETAAEVSPLPGDLDIWLDQLQKYAPPEIRKSDLPPEQAYKLWQGIKTYQEAGTKKEILSQALPRAIAELREDTKISPTVVLHGIVSELEGDLVIDQEITSFGTKAEMLKLAKDLLSRIAKDNAAMLGFAIGMGNSGKSGKGRKRLETLVNTMQPMLDRLNKLEEPELALILAMLTNKDYLMIWAKALGWDFKKPEKKEETVICL